MFYIKLIFFKAKTKDFIISRTTLYNENMLLAIVYDQCLRHLNSVTQNMNILKFKNKYTPYFVQLHWTVKMKCLS